MTAIDGYQMAKQGRAGAALAIAAIGSFIAGCIATSSLRSLRRSCEVCRRVRRARIFRARHIRPRADRRAVARLRAEGMAMAIVGVLFGLTGSDVFTTATRFTFGFDESAQRHRLRRRRCRHIRNLRDSDQPRERGRERTVTIKITGCCRPRTRSRKASAYPPRHGAWIGPRRLARRRRVPVLRSPRTPSRNGSRRTRRSSARARSRPWRARKPPTTRERRPPSSRC